MLAVLTGQELEYGADLQAQFLALLVFGAGLSRSDSETVAPIVFEAMQDACRELVEKAQEKIFISPQSVMKRGES